MTRQARSVPLIPDCLCLERYGHAVHNAYAAAKEMRHHIIRLPGHRLLLRVSSSCAPGHAFVCLCHQGQRHAQIPLPTPTPESSAAGSRFSVIGGKPVGTNS
jgi:hypothetical protein